jgi:hypothetical protein
MAYNTDEVYDQASGTWKKRQPAGGDTRSVGYTDALKRIGESDFKPATGADRTGMTDLSKDGLTFTEGSAGTKMATDGSGIMKTALTDSTFKPATGATRIGEDLTKGGLNLNDVAGGTEQAVGAFTKRTWDDPASNALIDKAALKAGERLDAGKFGIDKEAEAAYLGRAWEEMQPGMSDAYRRAAEAAQSRGNYYGGGLGNLEDDVTKSVADQYRKIGTDFSIDQARRAADAERMALDQATQIGGAQQGVRNQEQQTGLAQRQQEVNEEQFQKNFGLNVAQFNESQRQFDDVENRTRETVAAQFNLSVDQFNEAKAQFDAGHALQNAQLEEAIRTYDNTLATERDKFTAQYGMEATKYNEGIRQFDTQETRLRETTAAQYNLSVDQFNEAKAQFDAGYALDNAKMSEAVRTFNAQLAEQMNQFAQKQGLDTDKFTEAKRAAKVGEELQVGQLTGSVGSYDPSTGTFVTGGSTEGITGLAGNKTMAQKQLDENVRSNKFGEQLQVGQLTGVLGTYDPATGMLTGGGTNADGTAAPGGNKTLAAVRQETELALERARMSGSMGMDPETGEDIPTLEAKLAEADRLGTLDGKDTLQKQQFGLNKTTQELNDAIARAKTTGDFVDPVTGDSVETLEKKLAEADRLGKLDGQETLDAKKVQLLADKYEVEIEQLKNQQLVDTMDLVLKGLEATGLIGSIGAGIREFLGLPPNKPGDPPPVVPPPGEPPPGGPPPGPGVPGFPEGSWGPSFLDPANDLPAVFAAGGLWEGAGMGAFNLKSFSADPADATGRTFLGPDGTKVQWDNVMSDTGINNVGIVTMPNGQQGVLQVNGDGSTVITHPGPKGVDPSDWDPEKLKKTYGYKGPDGKWHTTGWNGDAHKKMVGDVKNGMLAYAAYDVLWHGMILGDMSPGELAVKQMENATKIIQNQVISGAMKAAGLSNPLYAIAVNYGIDKIKSEFGGHPDSAQIIEAMESGDLTTYDTSDILDWRDGYIYRINPSGQNVWTPEAESAWANGKNGIGNWVDYEIASRGIQLMDKNGMDRSHPFVREVESLFGDDPETWKMLSREYLRADGDLGKVIKSIKGMELTDGDGIKSLTTASTAASGFTSEDQKDIEALINKPDKYDPKWDLNNDGTIDFQDFSEEFLSRSAKPIGGAPAGPGGVGELPPPEAEGPGGKIATDKGGQQQIGGGGAPPATTGKLDNPEFGATASKPGDETYFQDRIAIGVGGAPPDTVTSGPNAGEKTIEDLPGL